jgi:hypothetical protein
MPWVNSHVTGRLDVRKIFCSVNSRERASMDGTFLESELALLASMENFFKKFEKSTPSPMQRPFLARERSIFRKS